MKRDAFNHPALVSTRKKETGSFQILPRSVRLLGKAPRSNATPPPPRDCTEITGFSENSRRKLRMTALNAWPELVSQFGLTYHSVPTDGLQVKADLRRFRDNLSKRIGIKSYLWILEFQRRGSPHFHLFLPCLPSEDLHRRIASAWLSASGQDSDPAAVAFHHHQRNFIKWSMGNGSYLCKYLEKECQKQVPEQYKNVGRFWGASRGLVPMPVDVAFDDFSKAHDLIDEETGECSDAMILAARWLGKWHERQTKKQHRKYARNFRKMAINTGWTLATGASAFLQIEKYLARQSQILREASHDIQRKIASYATGKTRRTANLHQVPTVYQDAIAAAMCAA